MAWQMDVERGRQNMAGFCSYCTVCNGKACAGKIPGMGGRDSGRTFQNNVQALQEIAVPMKILYDSQQPPDLHTNVLGYELSLPVMPSPIGGCDFNMSTMIDEDSYVQALMKGCVEEGIAVGLGDGAHDIIAQAANRGIARYPGWGLPFIKPWSDAIFFDKLKQLEKLEIHAVGIDLDSLGLSNVKLRGESIPLRTNRQLKALLAQVPYPVVVKGVTDADEAEILVELGAAGLVVSNHGGRILDCSPGTAAVLPAIVKRLKGAVPILVDGGVQTGLDVYKMMLLGADAVMIGRAFTRAVMSDLEQGAAQYIRQLKADFSHAMLMTGCRTVAEIYKGGTGSLSDS